MILQGKTLIVSGVGPGLGGEVARIAVRDGAHVVIAARGAAKLDAIAKELDPCRPRVAAHAFDMTDPAACEGLVAFAEQRFGGVDALVQVAAFDAVFGTLATTKADDWRRVMEVNVIGTTQLCRAVVPALETPRRRRDRADRLAELRAPARHGRSSPTRRPRAR